MELLIDIATYAAAVAAIVLLVEVAIWFRALREEVAGDVGLADLRGD